MRKIKTILALLMFISVVCTGLNGYAQPNVPKGNIPSQLPDDIKSEIEKLYSANPKQRTKAIQRLGNMGDRAAPAVPFLIGLLSDFAPLESQGAIGKIETTNMIRHEAIGALAKIGKPAVELLILTLQDENYGIRKLVAWALGEIGDVRAVEPLIAVVNDEKAQVRYRAVEALGKFKDPRIIEPLIAVLKDKDDNVRKQAVKILSKTDDPRLIKPMIAALQDKNSDVRYWAIDGLEKFNDPRAIELIIAALDDDSSAVRYRAVEFLGNCKEPRSVKPMINLLADPSEPVRLISLETLVKITGKNFGFNNVEWQKWWSENKGKNK